MGANLTIQCEIAEEYETTLRLLFEAAVEERNEKIEKYGDARKSNDWNAEYVHPSVQKSQDIVNKYAHKVWEENPYYFRDSYNATSIFWQIGLSWWQIIDQLLKEQNKGLPELDENATEKELIERYHILNVESCKKLLEIIDSAADTWNMNSVTRKSLEDAHAECKSDEDLIEWRRYFAKKLNLLRDFVRRAINLNASIYASA